MQPRTLTYDELTPLEQCIAEFMAKEKSFIEGRSALRAYGADPEARHGRLRTDNR